MVMLHRCTRNCKIRQDVRVEEFVFFSSRKLLLYDRLCFLQGFVLLSGLLNKSIDTLTYCKQRSDDLVTVYNAMQSDSL